MKILFRIIAGIIGGTVGGMGMGGGTLLIPILTIFLSFSQLQAQGVNLLAFIPMSIVAIILHAKNKYVKFKQTYLLAITGAILSFASALLATSLNNTILKKLFAVFLIGLGIWQAIDVIKAYKKKQKINEDITSAEKKDIDKSRNYDLFHLIDDNQNSDIKHFNELKQEIDNEDTPKKTD